MFFEKSCKKVLWFFFSILLKKKKLLVILLFVVNFSCTFVFFMQPCRDVVERVRSMCIQLSMISAPRDIRCIGPSLFFFVFFFLKQKALCSKLIFLKFLSLPILSFTNRFFFLISLLRLFFESKFFVTEKSLFPHFISLLLFSCFLSSFISPHVLSRRSDGRRQNTSSTEMSEGSGGKWSPRSEKKRVFCWFFWAWQGECVGWFF